MRVAWTQPDVNPMSEREPTQVTNLDRYGFPALLWSRARDAQVRGDDTLRRGSQSLAGP